MRGEDQTEQERDDLERATRVSEEVLREQLGTSPSALEEPPETVEATEPSTPEISEPSIVVTTLVGAKGLEAGHVFVAGVIGGHFPADNAHPTETEVCQFIVALTRSRKRVFVISARNYAGKWVDGGSFIGWLGQLAEKEVVDKDYPFGS